MVLYNLVCPLMRIVIFGLQSIFIKRCARRPKDRALTVIGCGQESVETIGRSIFLIGQLRYKSIWLVSRLHINVSRDELKYFDAL